MSSRALLELRQSNVTVSLRALILADTNRDAASIVLVLKQGGFDVNPTLVRTQQEFREAIAQEHFDAVLADYRLTDWSGLDALTELRNSGKDIPFLMVAGALGEEAVVESIKQGASDFILKEHVSRIPEALVRALAEKNVRDERAFAEEALRISEARNRELLENAIFGIACIAEDGSILDANPAFLHVVGCSEARELKKLNLARDLFRFPEQYALLLSACRDRSHVGQVEAEWRRRDGGIATVRAHMRQLSPAQSAGTFELSVEDITALRATERQVHQAQKFEAVGQLAGGVAHDFNNVIGAILGWAELGIDQSRDHPILLERFNRIREQANRAAALTRELLTFARRQVLQATAVDLNAVTSQLVSLLDKVIDKHIELKFVSTPLDVVKADPTQIEHALMNICINARDAMPNGGRLLLETEMVELDEPYCRFYPQVLPGRYAVVSVSDSGTGMSAETRERIFEPFFTTKESGKGTGMGLATVYGIVQQHNGFLHVYSEPDHGSLFRLYLPAMDDARKEKAAPRSETAPKPVSGGTETILLADDHESIREMTRQTLVQLGYRVLAACDGEEALRLCDGETPDLAILDVVMPKMGGVAAATKLAERFPALRVLLTSGYSAAAGGIPKESTDLRYLQKPYSPTALAHIVREILGPACASITH
jgi:two-component system, cell cycle sensor histidine kinase and response regulator CckA